MFINDKGTVTLGRHGFYEGYFWWWWGAGEPIPYDFSHGRHIKLRLVVGPDLLKERGLVPPDTTAKGK